jgi:uncharacterized protein YodC (DUF2158 family)
MAFKVGDVVTLKSKSPNMTVVEEPKKRMGSHDGQVKTAWFAGAKHETGFFPTDALVSAETDEKKK